MKPVGTVEFALVAWSGAYVWWHFLPLPPDAHLLHQIAVLFLKPHHLPVGLLLLKDLYGQMSPILKTKRNLKPSLNSAFLIQRTYFSPPFIILKGITLILWFHSLPSQSQLTHCDRASGPTGKQVGLAKWARRGGSLTLKSQTSWYLFRTHMIWLLRTFFDADSFFFLRFSPPLTSMTALSPIFIPAAASTTWTIACLSPSVCPSSTGLDYTLDLPLYHLFPFFPQDLLYSEHLSHPTWQKNRPKPAKLQTFSFICSLASFIRIL